HERAAVLGVPVALVGQLATQSDHRAARDRFTLAPSRLLGNLDVRLMWALAWRTPKDQQRDACADRADEPREFLMGRATDPWRARVRRGVPHASHSGPNPTTRWRQRALTLVPRKPAQVTVFNFASTGTVVSSAWMRCALST